MLRSLCVTTLIVAWCWSSLAFCQAPVMSGSPPTQIALVTPKNFEESQAKFRWAVQHFRELFPTQSVTRGDAAVNPLSNASPGVKRQLASIKGLRETLTRLEVDCFLVLHDGRVAAEDYVSCTARDLARWGQMLVDGGHCGQHSVVPAWFINDIRKNASVDLLREEPFAGDYFPDGLGYRSFFYLDGQRGNAIAAVGGYGQICYISPETNTVIVILSSPATFAERLGDGREFSEVWRDAQAEEKERWDLCREICSRLSLQ